MIKKTLNISKAIKKPGALRKTAGVKKGHKIPLTKLKELSHSKNKKTAQRARFALNVLRPINERHKKKR